MRSIFIDFTLSGHHLEYLHHYYRGALDRINDEFVFCVPKEDFLKQKDNYDWPEARNITFSLMSKDEVDEVICKQGIKRYILEAQLIANKSKELNANRVILTNFIHTIPYLLWIMPKGITVRGIIYRIYLYGQKNFRYIIENFCYRLMAKSNVMEKIFILNDQESSDKLNIIHKTNRFIFLPDPVPEVDMNNLENVRSKYNIPLANKVFLHFGGLTKRKGTLEILKAINLCEKDQLNDKTFVFAGRVYKDMKEEFYELAKLAKLKAQIIIFDEFCTYEFLYNLCYSSDVFLIPYQQTNLSSGVLGYASVFDKLVIGPNDGLIGNIIGKFNMGYKLKEISADEIAKSFNLEININHSDYARHNSVDAFINCIFE